MSTTEIVIGAGVFFLVLTWLAVFDIARKDFGTIRKKILWGFIALIPFVGPLVYFVIGFRIGKKPAKPDSP
ncbi:MAG: PLDc N-terminal domain-containing protein [Pseudomonadota bacterium]